MRIFFSIGMQFLVLIGCGTDNHRTTESKVLTPSKIAEYNGRDAMESKAIERIKSYLIENEPEVNIKDFYVDKIETKADTVIVNVHHYNYYVVLHRITKETNRIKALESSSDSAVYNVYTPPTGNWSGKDRVLLYLTKEDSLIDVLYQ